MEQQQLFNNFIQEYNAHISTGNIEKSIEILNKILMNINISNNYTLSIIYNLLGECYTKLNNNKEALYYYKKSSKLHKNKTTYLHLARLNENIEKKIKYLRYALEQEMDLLNLMDLADMYEKTYRYSLALDCYKLAIDLYPLHPAVFNNYGNQLKSVLIGVENRDELEYYKKAISLAVNTENYIPSVSNYLLGLLYKENLDYSFLVSESKKLMNININTLPERKLNNEKIKIGYISADFRAHPIGYMFQAIIENHNLDLFDIYCYDLCGKKDIYSQFLRKRNGIIWRDVSVLDDNTIANIIYNDNINILVEMMGHTSGNRLGILMYKPAPTIISYFAYPETTGLSCVDYKFVDSYTKELNIETHFTEKLLYLEEGLQCYTPPPILDTPNKSESNIIRFACFNNPHKFTKTMMEAWVEILKRVPNSTLTFRYFLYQDSVIREKIYTFFEYRGIERKRIHVGYQLLIQNLNEYNNIDFALDTHPYQGGTITSEALFMNTPVITIKGDGYRSSVGYCLNKRLNLEDYTANNIEEYINIAFEKANKKERINIIERMLKCGLANGKLFTKELENKYILL
jgi:protein O-GlcNAc transferase